MSERTEAERLLNEQRSLLADLEAMDAGEVACAGRPSSHSRTAEAVLARSPLVEHYRDLLQTYVVMGSGNLTSEMAKLADVLIESGASAQQAMQIHVEALEGMIHGLGRRSARHVMNRADLLGLEVMVHLADGYRQRLQERRFPAPQQLLPGFDAADVYAVSRAASACGLAIDP